MYAMLPTFFFLHFRKRKLLLIKFQKNHNSCTAQGPNASLLVLSGGSDQGDYYSKRPGCS
jgi:hypothetical protein